MMKTYLIIMGKNTGRDSSSEKPRSNKGEGMHNNSEHNKQNHKLIVFILFIISLLFMLPSFSNAAVMEDYCVIPPFIISGGVQPNLLMTIDNSGSMYDLSYVDDGKQDITGAFTRDPFYCYDQTYSNRNTYVGYFINGRCSVTATDTCLQDSDCNSGESCNDVQYFYDFVDERFEEYSGAFPIVCDRRVAGTICVNFAGTDPDAITAFIAKGNYLNWLTASKLDVEKEILTGGKYDTSTNELVAETRGCVGRRFVKEANDADFINYDDGEPNLNTSLNLTFGVKGPVHSINPTAPSPGGQTHLDVFSGNYQQDLCQEAIECFEPPGCTIADTRDAVNKCIVGSGGAGFCQNDPMISCTRKQDCPKIGHAWDTCVFGSSPEVKMKVVFAQLTQECWQHLPFNNPGAGWIDAMNTVKNNCAPEIYENYENGFCSVTTATPCNQDSDCPVAEVCNNGPRAVLPGNPAYICSTNYAGQCYTGGFPAWASTWTSDQCIIDESIRFCGDLDIPPVVDPTDDPSDTTQSANLPAIIADIGVESQLGAQVDTLVVDVLHSTEPEGLIQEFSNLIRMGAMSFNFDGSASECVVDDTVACPRVCSGHDDITCVADFDCPDFASGETCDDTTVDVDNLDGAKIIHYIGDPGTCSVNTGTTCSVNADCPDVATGEICNLVGNHDPGECSTTTTTNCTRDSDCPVGETCDMTLISSIDAIRADAWTPFSEGYYNAIGYFARTDAHTTPPTFGTGRTDVRLNPGDFDEDKNPSQYRCQSNNVLLISDGVSTADQNPDVNSLVSTYNEGDGQTGVDAGNGCPSYSGTRNLDDLAWIGQNQEITDFTTDVTSSTDLYKTIKTYTVYNGASSNEPGECNPSTLLQETADNGGGTYQQAENPAELRTALRNVFTELSAKAASGTAASVLASGSDEGANLLQAIFYPRRKFFTNTEIDWTGTLQNLWFFIDPNFGGTSIREDTVDDSMLNREDDYVVQFRFDPDAKRTVVDRYDDEFGDGSSLPYVDEIEFELMNNLWEAGRLLWQRDITSGADPRTIVTTTDGTSFTAFSTANALTLQPYLQAAGQAESEAIIRYIHGEDTRCSITTSQACSFDSQCPAAETCGGFNPIIDINGDSVADFTDPYRLRTVEFDLDNDGSITAPDESARVWKLGDIVNSTPRIVTWVPLNSYHLEYDDFSYKAFVNTSDYQNRGMVFAGANDGMLHAFKLGKLEVEWSGQGSLDYARLVNPDTGNPCSSSDAEPCGREEWAFIPKHVLPFIKYNADKGYCHLYNVDGSPFVFDASIGDDADVARASDGSSWKTILIGSMKYGGSCRKSDNVACTDCVKAPGVDIPGIGGPGVDTDYEKTLGLSEYFAIDITDPDPANWDLLWEFTNEDLGFSTSGPAVVRVHSKDLISGDIHSDTNGEWFAVFVSGPTGPIDTTTHQFLGRSDQNLKVFVVDLRDGTLKATFDTFDGSAIPNAFGGSIIGATVDPDLDYQDDGLYIGYTNSVVGAGDTWLTGGVIRLQTKEDQDPANWVPSKVMENIGSVTASVGRLQNTITGKLWLYFGTGRYYYKSTSNLDDPATQRTLFGIKEPCFSGLEFDTTCTQAVPIADLNDVTSLPDASEDDEGWFITLDAQGDPEAIYDAERVITDPVASTLGATFFTTFKPAADICGFGGRSHLWAVKFNTGGSAAGLLRGKALLQVSTGSIEEINLKDAFKTNDPDAAGHNPDLIDNPDSKGDRRSGAFAGKPPEGPGLILLVSPPPYESIIHMMER
jgi:type IV pilus assembly protein PilY1